eukprot:CAMPEP_0181218604 /NCGR_PEP_ID=MMETSP1096-20121128/27784_1 /TAXON_ID=156174 ORGANISM="Chrysochromulina ericina, Strain CCMP281" /NCGR_SAMPLE_ID=MMETSP1096 /ASSEMBLY_ACC=CAM_ASM_000453 /LENGTH=100 /DNA_ID=CAMNT_0023310835 /DNA_START=465 /DNA_END=767 /DNA_ORIENTATION=+
MAMVKGSLVMSPFRTWEALLLVIPGTSSLGANDFSLYGKKFRHLSRAAYMRTVVSKSSVVPASRLPALSQLPTRCRSSSVALGSASRGKYSHWGPRAEMN